jgi:phage terminase large subunit-like protein
MIDEWIKEQIENGIMINIILILRKQFVFINFTQKLTVDKGKKGQRIKLLKFQFLICTDILCVKRISDNLRKHREAHINISRKNGNPL